MFLRIFIAFLSISRLFLSSKLTFLSLSLIFIFTLVVPSSLIKLQSYGNPKERDKEKIIDDYKQEYISKKYIEKYHPNISKDI